jgi:hypothetical protein
MARLRKNVVGLISGKLNELVFKHRLGTPYVCTSPLEFKMSQTPASIEGRDRFGFSTSLSSALYKDFFIQTLWDESGFPGETARNKIMKFNNLNINISRDRESYCLVPPANLFDIVILNVEEESGLIKITFAPFDIPYNQTRYPVISAHGIMHLFNAGPNTDRAHFFDPVISEKTAYIKGTEHTISIPFNSNMLNYYGSKEFCMTLILENKNGKPKVCSKNVIC